MAALALGLAAYSTLLRLDLELKGLTAAAATVLSASLRTSSLSELLLRRNALGRAAPAAAAASARVRALARRRAATRGRTPAQIFRPRGSPGGLCLRPADCAGRQRLRAVRLLWRPAGVAACQRGQAAKPVAGRKPAAGGGHAPRRCGRRQGAAATSGQDP